MSNTRTLYAQPHESGVGATTVTDLLTKCQNTHPGGCAFECVAKVMESGHAMFPHDLAVVAVERALWLGELTTENGRIFKGYGEPELRERGPVAILRFL